MKVPKPLRTFPMVIGPYLSLTDAFSSAVHHRRRSRQLALKAAHDAHRAGDRVLAATATALANALEIEED